MVALLLMKQKNLISDKLSPTKINYFAWAALAFSISGFFLGFTFIIGIILGHVSLYRINRLSKETNGALQAAWALIIGYFGLACFFIFFSSLFIAVIQYVINANI